MRTNIKNLIKIIIPNSYHYVWNKFLCDGQWKVLLIDHYVMRELSHAFND